MYRSQACALGLNKEQCEECLMPLSHFYDSQFEDLFLQSNVFETIINHECTMIDKCLAIIKQFTLSDSLLIAHVYVDLIIEIIRFKILDILKQYLSIRKESYLILANLSYNDCNAAIKIIDHPISFKIIENIVVSSNKKNYCMSVILNFQATGDEIDFFKQYVVFQKLSDVGLIKQMLESILRFLVSKNIKEQLRQQNFTQKLDKILQAFDYKMIEELHAKITQLL